MFGYKGVLFYILTIFFTNKLMVQQWAHLFHLPLLSHFCHTMKKNWLNNRPQGFKPVFYRRYVDDMFILFKSIDHLKYFQDFLYSCHINMPFSMETFSKFFTYGIYFSL